MLQIAMFPFQTILADDTLTLCNRFSFHIDRVKLKLHDHEFDLLIIIIHPKQQVLVFQFANQHRNYIQKTFDCTDYYVRYIINVWVKQASNISHIQYENHSLYD